MVFMKKFNFLTLLIVLFGLGSSHVQAFLTHEDIEGAKKLAKSTDKLEEVIPLERSKSWLTIEEFQFEYKGNKETFWVANTFSCSARWGHIVLCENSMDSADQKNNLKRVSLDKFSDFTGQPILSHLFYEFIEGEQPHFILEKVNAGCDDQNRMLTGRGYSQACVKYFLDEFISKHTNVTHVFSDCRNPASRHYFPNYGFKAGTLTGYSFKRAMTHPYYWIKEETTNTH